MEVSGSTNLMKQQLSREILAPQDVNAVREQLASLSDGDSAKAVEGVESMFLSLLMKEMRSSMTEGGFFGEENSDSYGGLFDMMMSQSLAQGNPLGVGKLVEQQMQRMGMGLDSEDLDATNLNQSVNSLINTVQNDSQVTTPADGQGSTLTEQPYISPAHVNLMQQLLLQGIMP